MPVRALAQSGTAASVTGTLVETTLATITVPAGCMLAGGALRITCLWAYTNSANTKTLRVRFGGTSMDEGTVTTSATLETKTMIYNTAVAAQVASGAPITTRASVTSTANMTAAINTAVAQDITIQGTLANTGETITLVAYCVELIVVG